MLGTKKVVPGYQQWRGQKSVVQSLPDHFKDDGMSPAVWEGLEAVRTQRKKIRAELAAEINALAEKYRKELLALEKAFQVELDNTSSPWIKVVEGGFQHLELVEQLAIEQKDTPAERKVALNAALLKARKRWVEKARAGEEPY